MISISYRREDSLPIAGRLYDRLQARFGRQNVFMDFDSIPPGVDFREQIKRTIERSDLVIAVIGPRWLGERSDSSRRIDDPTDFVRLEIQYALKRGIPVIPLLVDNAPMPKPEKLPSEIEGLAFRNALSLDSGIDFNNHAARLINGILNLVEKPIVVGSEGRSSTGRKTKVFGWSTLVIPVLAIAIFYTFARFSFMGNKASFHSSQRLDEGTSPVPTARAQPEPNTTPLSEQSPAASLSSASNPTSAAAPVEKASVSSADSTSPTSSGVMPRVERRKVRTGSFHMTSMNTIFAVRGVFDGTYDVTEDDIEVRIARAVIEVNEKYNRRQLVSEVLFSLGVVIPPTIWPVGNSVKAFSVNKEMGPREEYYPGPCVVWIPVPQSTDLSKVSLTAQIFSDEPGQSYSGANCTVVSQPGIFAPAPRRSQKSR